jgi:hypothetical protein
VDGAAVLSPQRYTLFVERRIAAPQQFGPGCVKQGAFERGTAPPRFHGWRLCLAALGCRFKTQFMFCRLSHRTKIGSLILKSFFPAVTASIAFANRTLIRVVQIERLFERKQMFLAPIPLQRIHRKPRDSSSSYGGIQ